MSKRFFLIVTIVTSFGYSSKCQIDPKGRQFINQHNKNDIKNVLLLLFDDLRYDVFSFMGSVVNTPNIDELASHSVYFENACTTTGLCSPSRAALFTGKWGHRTNLDDNILLNTSRLTGLDLNETTLLEWSREKGYFVGYFGKWHLGADGPLRRGAHRWDSDGIERQNTKNYFSNPDDIQKFYQNRDFKEKSGYFSTIDGSYKTHGSKDKVRNGINFIKEVKEVGLPFFLTVSFNGPHPPYKVPEPYNHMYNPEKIQLPENFDDSFINKPIYQRWHLWYWHDVDHMSKMDWKKTIAYHNGLVSMLDKAVGEIILSLKSEGYWENTMIILAGDQGSMLADHRLYDKGPYSYEKLMRIPLLIRVPGINESSIINRQVSIIDINKTIVEWLGLEPIQEDRDSKSLMPLIREGDNGWETPDEAFYAYEWYNGVWFGIRTIRTPEYKYCFNPTSINELYDLKNDPFEIVNRIYDEDYQNIKKNLEDRLLTHLIEIKDPLHKRLGLYLKINRNNEN